MPFLVPTSVGQLPPQAFVKGVVFSEILTAGPWNQDSNFFQSYCKGIIPSTVSLLEHAVLS